MIDAPQLQRRLGVTPDGDIGPITLAALFVRLGATSDTGKSLGVGAAVAFPAAGLLASDLRLAHATAQLGHESGGFRYMTELWGPTDAQRRYEGRPGLGNAEPGDGYRFRGRGLIQLTGRANYRNCGRALGLDLEAAPELAAVPATAVGTACWYWTARGLNALADRDDLEAVTRAINGGLNGLADRRARLLTAKALFA